jgi:urease accessory protein
MRQINKNLGKTKIANTLLSNIDSIKLPFLQRSKSRQLATLENGEAVTIVLHRGSVMRGGDILVDDNGKFIRVIAASEQLLRVSAKNTFDLIRAAYHLGNRHIPIEIHADYLQLEFDPVLMDLLKNLGVLVSEEIQPFEPEHGAYGGGHKHGHDQSFAQDYVLAQAVFQEHEHNHGHDTHHNHDHS